MYIHCLGINHQTASVSLRELLAFTEDSIKAALARLGCGHGAQPDAISEMVILSTCNRVEIYAVSPHPAMNDLVVFLEEVSGVKQAEFNSSAYQLTNDDAFEHLFRVAAGLDSLVLGEPQILGQVMQAFELARSQNAAGPVLSRLFQAALHAGKRARTETTISHNPATVSSMAIRLAEQVVQDLPAAQILVVGAGEMAELAVEALRKRGANRILVVNRTLERARLLADRWNGEAATFEQLPEALRRADILLASTGAPHTLIYTNMVERAMQARLERPLVVIDIAVPRDVEEAVGNLTAVSLYDMDDLYSHLENSLAERERQVPQVERILKAELDGFRDYLELLDVLPVIAAMRQQAEMIRQAELEKTLRRLPYLSEDERKRLEALTQALVKKILHAPITCLRSEAGSSKSTELVTSARTLFGIEGQGPMQHP